MHSIQRLAFRASFAVAVSLGTVTVPLLAAPVDKAPVANQTSPTVKRVLMVTVEGLHSLDLALLVQKRPNSVFTELSKRGTTYTNASTYIADALPSFMGMVSGGSPSTTGLYFTLGYDRNLSPAGSDCSKRGAETIFDDTSGLGPVKADEVGLLDLSKLARDPDNGCKPVLPRDYLRVNTIFEIVKRSGGRTAWIDRHAATADFLVGPSGDGLDDILTREPSPIGGHCDVPCSETYDDGKLRGLLNEIKGFDHTGKNRASVPTLFGMTFISPGVAQKKYGYVDGAGTPSQGFSGALDFLEQSLGKIVGALKAENLYGSTLIVLTAKHGQSPMDITKKQRISDKAPVQVVEAVQKGLLAYIVQEDMAFIWLTNPNRTEDVAAELRAKQVPLGIMEVYTGEALKLRFPDPKIDSRAPDIVYQCNLGVFYADLDESTKVAEHGGFLEEDVNVPLLLSFPGSDGRVIKTAVKTTQLAPTILTFLGLDPQKLKAVETEQTRVLPGLAMK